jgi:hypothetical protein
VPELRRVVGNRPDNDLVFPTARSHSLRANNWWVREFNAAEDGQPQGASPPHGRIARNE